MPGLCTDGLRHWARVTPDQPLIIFRGEVITYADMYERACTVADALEDRGVAPGDVVGVIGNNSVEWCTAALGILLAGAVLAGYNQRLVPAELAQLVDNSDPVIVMAGAAHVSRMAEVLDAGARFALMELAEVSELRPAPDSAMRARARGLTTDPAAPAMIVYTSGTSGVPKGVVFTHQSILGSVMESMLLHRVVGPDSRRLAVMPMATAAGFFDSVMQQVVRGAGVVLEPEFRPDEALQAIIDHHVTYLSGPPILYERIAAAARFDESDLSQISLAQVGGAKVPAKIFAAWERKGVVLRQLYGATEMGGVATVASPDEARRKPNSCGKGGVLSQIRVVRPDGTDCAPGEPGEFIARGPGFTPGYWRNPVATQELLVDGWLRTGDLGMADEDGSLIYIDRLKDIIISGGLNISPVEIETVINQLAAVAETAVVAVPDEKFGEVAAAIVTATEPIDRAAIVDHCRGQLADFKVPMYFVIGSDPLPRMPSGKCDKRLLRQRYREISDEFRRS